MAGDVRLVARATPRTGARFRHAAVAQEGRAGERCWGDTWNLPTVIVEIAEELTAVARRNVEASRHRLRCQNVEHATPAALSWELPDDATILFLYNSVRGETFRAFVDKLVAALDRASAAVFA
jgi:hypothetical protein